jgi:mannitol 2-dehydrogenase
MTSDVLPYEKMKMRLLNASHQTLCYSISGTDYNSANIRPGGYGGCDF